MHHRPSVGFPQMVFAATLAFVMVNSRFPLWWEKSHSFDASIPKTKGTGNNAYRRTQAKRKRMQAAKKRKK